MYIMLYMTAANGYRMSSPKDKPLVYSANEHKTAVLLMTLVYLSHHHHAHHVKPTKSSDGVKRLF